MNRKVLVAGASGFVGSNLVHALRARGRDVLCGSRDPTRAAKARPGWTWTHFDLDDAGSIASALEGVDALVFLVHQMGDPSPGLEAREELSAFRVREAAEAAGVRRIVYLGGPAPRGEASEHLRARIRTGEVLRGGDVSTIELRAAMIVGAGSESWTICRDLALRLPVMVLPRWLDSRSQPLAVDDVVAALVHAVDDPLVGSEAFDLPGPEAMTARQILERVAGQAGMRPLMIPIPLMTPRLSSMWLGFVTRADLSVARKLVDGLDSDLQCAGDGYWVRMPHHTRLGFDAAARKALAEEAPHIGRAGQLWERVARRVARRT